MFNKILIATAVALTLGMSSGAQASTSTFDDNRVVNEYLSPITEVSKKTSLKPTVQNLVKKHEAKDDYFSYRLLFTVYSDKKSGFYSLFKAKQALEGIAEYRNGLFASFALAHYGDEKSVFYSPSKAARLAVICAEAGDKTCVADLYDRALLDGDVAAKLTPKIRGHFMRSVEAGKLSDQAKFTYARAVGTGLAQDNGKADAMLMEAAKNLHQPSLDMVVSLYKEDFYGLNENANIFFYTYLKGVSTNTLDKHIMGDLYTAFQAISPSEQRRVLTAANDILKAKKIPIPYAFDTP